MNMKNADNIAKSVGLKMNALEKTSKSWGLKYLDGGEGWAKASMRIRNDMLNGHGNLHGGLIFALADTAFAYACNSRNQVSVAQQASISFLSPGQLGETLTAFQEKTENPVVQVSIPSLLQEKMAGSLLSFRGYPALFAEPS